MSKATSLIMATGAAVGSSMEIPFLKQQPNGEFHPKQHKVESYRSQQRAAKKRKNIK